MALDATTRACIAKTITDAITQAMEGANEKWVSGEQLTEYFAFFTPSWLRRYGETLPRTRAIVTDAQGAHSSGWCYPLHKIQRMVQNGDIKNLRVLTIATD